MPEIKFRAGRSVLVVLLTGGLALPASAGAPLTEADCNRDEEAMFEGMATARADGVRKLEIMISQAGSDEERNSLIAEREELWDREERERVFADTAWRDCLRYVRERRARSE